MTWSDKYIGIPYKPLGRSLTGSDCWGLVTLVYANEHDIALDNYDGQYASVKEQEQIHALISNAAMSDEWVPIIDYKPTDVLAFRTGANVTHIGLWVKPGMMLHTAHGHNAMIERYETGRWGQRLVGVYRHKSLL